MKNTMTIVADDFGLTRGITDTILEVVDDGPVRLVSILTNGEAVEYAIEEYKKRSEHLALAVHLNLTEGKALSVPSDIPHLVDVRGMFKRSVAGLWGAYLFGSHQTRAALGREVSAEMKTQCAVIRTALGVDSLVVNSHQHVHMIPFVFDELIKLPGIVGVRMVREPFQFSWSVTAMFARLLLSMLSNRFIRIARLRNITTNDSFIGFVHSGHMTEKTLRTGLANAKGSVEVLFHPGSATIGELLLWQKSRADIRWHYSPWRNKERDFLKSPRLMVFLREV